MVVTPTYESYGGYYPLTGIIVLNINGRFAGYSGGICYTNSLYGATPGTHYILNELYNELIRLNYYGIIDFLGDQGTPRGV